VFAFALPTRLLSLAASVLLACGAGTAASAQAPIASPASDAPNHTSSTASVSPRDSGASVGDALTQSLATCRLDDTLLDANVQAVLIDQGLLVTSRTIRLDGLTEPSLWWARQQLRDEKLVADWLALPGLRRVEVLVNLQLWRSLNYIERYSFVTRFGTVAREYGYELRVFDPQPECLAVYNCLSGNSSLPHCQVDLQPPLRDILSL